MMKNISRVFKSVCFVLFFVLCISISNIFASTNILKDDEIKIRYLERSEYANCYSSIVASLKDEDKILFYFDKYLEY